MGTNILFELSNKVKDNDRTIALLEDAALVSSSRTGNLGAFEALVTRYQKRMLNIAYRMVNDYDEACDIVQDVFVSAYRNIKNFRGESNFCTWLTAITVNHAKNRLKQLRARQVREVFSIDEPIQREDGEMVIDPPSNEPSILDKIENRDFQQKVQECISALEPEFREVMVLRDIQGFSYEEICGVLKMRDGTVKSRLFRARDAVRKCLKKATGDFHET